MSNEQIKKAEEFLDERYNIAQMPLSSKADEIYYRGACEMILQLGFDFRRDENGKHEIYI